MSQRGPLKKISGRNAQLRKIVLLGILGLLTQALTARADHVPTNITWSQPAVSTTLGPGDEKRINISFVASKNIERVTVQVSPEIALFVHTVPSDLRHIRKGDQHTLTVIVSPAPTSAVGSFAGAIQLSKGKLESCDSECDDSDKESAKILAEPLPVTVNIWPSIVSNDLGIAFNIPPGWSVATNTKTLNLLPPGAVISTGVEYTGEVLICVDENPANLTPEEFYDGHNQEDLAHDAETVDHIIVAGRPAVRFGGIGAGFSPGDVVVFPLPGQLIRFEQNSGSDAFEQIIQTLRVP